MKTELLCMEEKWIKVDYTSREDLLEQYPKVILVTCTDEYDYYASNGSIKILFRMKKPERMTKEEAEKKYGIEITGPKLVKE